MDEYTKLNQQLVLNGFPLVSFQTITSYSEQEDQLRFFAGDLHTAISKKLPQNEKIFFELPVRKSPDSGIARMYVSCASGKLDLIEDALDEVAHENPTVPQRRKRL